MTDTGAPTFPPAARVAGGLSSWILGLLLVLSLRQVADSPGFFGFQIVAAIAALACAVGFLRQLPWAPRAASFFVFLMLSGAVASFVLAGRAIDLVSAALLAVVAFSGSAVARSRPPAAVET